MAPWLSLSAASRATFWRSLQTFTVSRIVIALVLLLYLSVDARRSHLPARRPMWGPASPTWRGMRLRRRHLPLAPALPAAAGKPGAVDIGAISLLYLAAGGLRSGLALLYLFPLAGAAMLAPLLLALFSAALATLFVLSKHLADLRALRGRAADAGRPDGAAFFALVLVVNRLAAG
jgi:two-component system sensor histidine kinase PilS (NtrC family)